MADLAFGMWRILARAFHDRDPRPCAELEPMDARMDSLQRSILAGLGADDIEPRCAVNLALLARFYERLGDHALHVAQRLRFLATGE